MTRVCFATKWCKHRIGRRKEYPSTVVTTGYCDCIAIAPLLKVASVFKGIKMIESLKMRRKESPCVTAHKWVLALSHGHTVNRHTSITLSVSLPFKVLIYKSATKLALKVLFYRFYSNNQNEGGRRYCSVRGGN